MNNVCGFELHPAKDTKEKHFEGLDEVNKQIAELKRIKDHLEKRILEGLHAVKFDEAGNILSVAHEGSQTKYIGKYKAVIKTPALWKIDKNEYEAVAATMRKEFNPVVQSTTYRVNNKILQNIDTYGSEEDKQRIGQFLVLDYSKPSIILSLNV